LFIIFLFFILFIFSIVDVPNTNSNASVIFYIVGGLILATTAGFVYYNGAVLFLSSIVNVTFSSLSTYPSGAETSSTVYVPLKKLLLL